MKNEIPVYHLTAITHLKEQDVLVSRFLPYSVQHKHFHSAHRHSFYHLVLFTSGSGTHSIDFKTYPVEPFQIYFMVPGQVHSWNFSSEPEGYVVNFTEAFFQSFLLKQNFLTEFRFFRPATDSVFTLQEDLRPVMPGIFEEILKEGETDLPHRVDYVRILLLRLFILLSRSLPAEPQLKSSYNHTLLNTFKSLVELHFKDRRLPREYAELLYITPNHLNALCSDLLGISAGQVIRNRIVLEAKRLLINLELSISEIAYQLNFTDNSYFSKFFRKQAGISPEEFRKSMINE